MMTVKSQNKTKCEVDLYGAVMSLFADKAFAFVEVPYLRKRVDFVFATTSLQSLYAVEVKISNWRSALKQAALNQLFAQRSYVALPASAATRLEPSDRELFSRYHVGLIAVEESAWVELPAVKNGYLCLADYREMKKTLEFACRSQSPKGIGAVSHAVANGSRTLELLQTGSNKRKGPF